MTPTSALACIYGTDFHDYPPSVKTLTNWNCAVSLTGLLLTRPRLLRLLSGYREPRP